MRLSSSPKLIKFEKGWCLDNFFQDLMVHIYEFSYTVCVILWTQYYDSKDLYTIMVSQ